VALEPLSAGDPGEIGGYRLHARLGAGGMGRVYLAFTPGGRPVALKAVRPEFGDDPEFRRRFLREVQASRQVHGLYTAQVLDADPDAAQPWLVTAYVPGPSLQQAVARHGPLPLPTVLLLMAGVAEALQAIHAAGLVHRDMKPSNVLLARDGPRVIDFGIARAIAGTGMTRTGMMVGSPQYMAPEQIADRPVSAAIDVFALGALAAYAVSGKSPFGEGSDPAMLYRIVHQPPSLDSCPEPLRALVARCLAKEPAARPTPGEILRTCRSASAGQPPQIAGSWLPPAVVADFSDRAGPAQASSGPATASPALASPARAGYAQPGNRPAGYQVPGFGPFGYGQPGAGQPERRQRGRGPSGSGPLAYGPPPYGASVYARPGSGAGRPLAGASATARPGRSGGGSAGDGSPDTIRRGSPGKAALVAVVALVLVAVAVGGLLAARHEAAQRLPVSSADSPTRNPSRSAASAAAASPSAGTKQAGQTAAQAACLVGSWAGVTETVVDQINGEPVTLAGRGANQLLAANGKGLTSYGAQTVFTATVGGNRWDYVVRGWAAFTWTARNERLLIGGVVPHGTWTLRENGRYDGSGTLSLSAAPERYACSGGLLRVVTPSGSVVLRRR
jgi:serine/threonine kinase PknH